MTEASDQFVARRQQLGLSVHQAARLCDVDDRTIRRWDRGSSAPGGRDPHPSAMRLLDLATEYPLARMWLLELAGLK